jgi:hypothetical protein
MSTRDNITDCSSYPDRYRQLAQSLGGQLVGNAAGCYCRIDTTVDWFDRLGQVDLGQFKTIESFPLAAFTKEETPGQVALGDIVCIDTETTGLGGTGTVPFLIGCGRPTADGFSVRQFLLPDYSDETALLEDVLAELSSGATLVTYNGVAFDLPLIRDRLVLNRVARDLPARQHLDLLHPTRRLFKRRLKDCSLINIERELFGHIRSDDIPGYLIPSVYFEWLNDQATANLRLVLEHNRQDIVTLIYLCHQVASAFVSEGRSLSKTDDLHSLSQVYGRRRDTARALALYDRMEQETDSVLAPDILLYHSFILKRTRDWDRAITIWHSLSSHSTREGYWACVELAKYFEHQLSDWHSARAFTHRAIHVCPYGEEHRRRLSIRLDRIAGKIHI